MTVANSKEGAGNSTACEDSENTELDKIHLKSSFTTAEAGKKMCVFILQAVFANPAHSGEGGQRGGIAPHARDKLTKTCRCVGARCMTGWEWVNNTNDIRTSTGRCRFVTPFPPPVARDES